MTPHSRSPTTISRRQFLLFLAAAPLACRRVIADTTNPAASTVTRPGRIVNAGPVSNYARDGLYARFRDQGFFVVRQGEKLFALSSTCTHRKCTLSAESNRSFTCPCHGSTFDPNGKVTSGPARLDLPILPTSTDATSHLLVTVPS